MDLKKILYPDVISLDLPGNTKNEIIESLLDLLMGTGKVKDRDAALECILEREKKMSTGIQNGVAIPHGKTPVVDELVACVGLKKPGVDFEALDNQPSNIFIMTLSPINRTGPHLQFLAEVGRLLKQKDQREAFLAAATKEEVLSIIVP
jgi:mannitol/fructose-specific phosphotransferase system IIA component (Ntr-type)